MTQPARQPSSPWRVHPAAWAIFLIGMAVLAFALFRPIAGGSADARAPMRIVVAIPPLMWAVRGLAPADAEVVLLSPAGAGCTGIELTPAQVSAIRRADLVVRVGAGLDDSVAAIVRASAMPDRQDIALSALPDDHHAGTAREQHSGEHVHSDPHLWLDPSAMERLIIALRDAFRRAGRPADPSRVDALIAECRRIDEDYRRLADMPSRLIVADHDAWRGLAGRYGLEVAAVIRHSHDTEPTPGDIAEAARAVRERGVRAVFVEPQFPHTAARRIAEETGAKILTLDPLGDGDWPAMMRRNLDALVEGLSAGRKP